MVPPHGPRAPSDDLAEEAWEVVEEIAPEAWTI